MSKPSDLVQGTLDLLLCVPSMFNRLEVKVLFTT